ncbi:MAG: oligosaccharide flippase family protein [Armatimonadetes bacterium]|nr:oligosaccharide flippase family protein [Armatimonadota bacterium]
MLGAFLTLVTWVGLGQLVALLVSPLLARLYDPGAFGVFSIFTAVAGILASFATGRYDQALLLEEQDSRAADLLTLATRVCMATCLSLWLLLWLLRPLLLSRFSVDPAVAYWLPLTPALTFGVAMLFALNAWFNRTRSYRLIAGSKAFQSVFGHLVMVTLGFAGWGAAGLVWGTIAGYLGAILWMGLLVRRAVLPYRPTAQALRQAARDHRDFPLYSAPANLIQFLCSYSILFGTMFFYSAEWIGLFALAQRVTVAPLILVRDSIVQVFSRELTLRPVHRRSALYLKTLGLSVLVFSGLALPIVLFGPKLFALVFGSRWETAGMLARNLAPWLISSMSVNAVLYIFAASGRNRDVLIWQIAYLGGTGAMLYRLSSLGLPELLLYLSAYSAVMYSILAVMGLGVLGGPVKSPPPEEIPEP